MARVQEAALEVVGEGLLHAARIEEREGGRIGDARVHVAVFTEHEQVLRAGGRVEAHDDLREVGKPPD
jgi:hypothetical protein